MERSDILAQQRIDEALALLNNEQELKILQITRSLLVQYSFKENLSKK